MRIAILSRNKNLHSIRRLLQEARRLKLDCDVIHPLECQLVVQRRRCEIWVGGQPLPEYSAVLPRIGASITDYGLAVVRQFESIGVRAVNGSRAIGDSRDKMRCLQVLAAAGVPVPGTVLSRSLRGSRSLLERLGGMPVVMKLLRGTQGVGVMLVHSQISMRSVVETLQGLDRDVLLQEFIRTGHGRDYRVIVVGGKAVATMERKAPRGDFRSNIHRGGEGTPARLPKAYTQAAVRAAKSLGLEIAGVDLMETDDGPVVIEVNSSPGFEGIERATGLNIAREIVKHLAARARSTARTKRRRR